MKVEIYRPCMTSALRESVDSKNIYDCLDQPFNGDCWAHAWSKACSHSLKDENVTQGLKRINVTNTRKVMQSCVTWTKKSGKGKMQWEQSCIQARLRPRTIPTPVKTRWASYLHMFSRLLEYREAVRLCYTNPANEQKVKKRNPTDNHWEIVRVIVDTMKPVITAIIANQSRDYWILSDALVLAINMVIDCRRINTNMSIDSDLDADQDEDDDDESLTFDQQLIKFSCNIRSQIISILESFLKFTKEFQRDKAHCMIALCLDHRHKRMKCLIEYLSDKNKANQIVTEYDEKVLVPMLKDAYKKLHNKKADTTSISRLHNQTEEQKSINDRVDREHSYSCGLFSDELPTPEDKIITDACIAELKNFRLRNISDEEMKLHTLDWWRENRSHYPIIASVAKDIHGIPASQVEVERIFSIAGILTGMRRCNLGVLNLDSIVKIVKNWPDNHKLDQELQRKIFSTFGK